MSNAGGFDPKFDFRTDATGPDPDSSSPTLKAYHKLLWSKPLPSGDPFDLDDTTGPYLYHQSARGEFYLTSDSACQTWTGIGWSKSWAQRPEVIPQIPESELEQFLTTAHQIGGKMLFPTGNGRTINQERGTHRQIADRLDLTLECIRLHYFGETSPLEKVLIRYGEFFALFEDFSGYTDFFLLEDLLSDDLSSVDFLMPFAGFGASGLPSTLDEYQGYRLRAMAFVEARNRRMADYAAGR